MKWIGQHIVDLIARFRSTVYLENLSDPATDTDKFLVAGSDGKVGYRTGAEVLVDIEATDTIYDDTAIQAEVDLNTAKETNVVQTTITGNAATASALTSGNKTITGDLDISGNILPGITTIKILPRDFIADDGGRPVQIDDSTSGNRHIESHDVNPLFASVEIPPGFKATLVDIYGTLTSAVTVYEANVTTRIVTSRGTGNINTTINIQDVTSSATNYLLIELAQASGEQVFGGIVTIAKA